MSVLLSFVSVEFVLFLYSFHWLLLMIDILRSLRIPNSFLALFLVAVVAIVLLTLFLQLSNKRSHPRDAGRIIGFGLLEKNEPMWPDVIVVPGHQIVGEFEAPSMQATFTRVVSIISISTT